MNAITLIIAGITALYALSSLLIFYGALRQRPQRISHQPFVSVLIAARNEEQRLPRCLHSLVRANYPSEKFEVIIIDDRSRDGTRQIAENFARHHSQVKIVSIQHRLKNLSGKANALCQGLARAGGEIILMTDADCQAPANWIAQMVSYFTPEMGLVGGFTLLTQAGKKNSILAKIQTLDWLYLLTIASGAAGLGKPVSIIGNNFAFRRAAYDAIGGYEKIGVSIIEDFALMRAIHKQTHWRIVFPFDPQLAMASAPTTSWREFFDQRQRWAAGGKEVGWLAKGLMAIAFFGHWACFMALFISPKLAMSCFLVAVGVDFLLLWKSARRLERQDLLAIFPLFEIYYFLYGFFFAPTVLLPVTVRWKDRQYRWNFRGKINRVEESV